MINYTTGSLILSGFKSPNDASDFADSLQHMILAKGFITVEDVKRAYFITDNPNELVFGSGEDKVGWTSFKNVNMKKEIGRLDVVPTWVVSFPPAKKLFENETPPLLPKYVPKPKKELSVLYTLAVVFALALEIVICIAIVYLALGLL